MMGMADLIAGHVERPARVNVRSVAAGLNEAVTAGVAEQLLCITGAVDEMIAENSRDHAALLLEMYGPVPPVVQLGQGSYVRRVM
jgi:hypothetical protein